MLYSTVLYHAVQCKVGLNCTVQCSTMLYSVELDLNVQCCYMLYSVEWDLTLQLPAPWGGREGGRDWQQKGKEAGFSKDGKLKTGTLLPLFGHGHFGRFGKKGYARQISLIIRPSPKGRPLQECP